MSLPINMTHFTFPNIDPFFKDRVHNKGEGNCFFHAVGEYIPGEYSTTQLRQKVASYLQTLDSSITHYDEEEWKKILNIRKDKVWVDDIWTHYGISELFRVSLHIYRPEVTDQVLIIEDSKQCNKTIIPLILSGQHYETIPKETRESYIEEYTKKSSVEMWSCTACTFENHNALDKCEICGKKMPNLI